MMANNLQQSLRELRSHRKLPEREGEYWSDEEREDLSRKFNEGAGISEIAVALHRSEPAIMQQIESSIYLTARRIHGVSVPQDS